MADIAPNSPIAGLVAAAQRLSAQLRVWRLPIGLIAGALMLGGIVWSVNGLSLRWSDIAIAPLLVLFFVMGPLAIAYGALGMQLLARAAASDLRFGSAFRIAGAAQLAEILPVPGGAAVRIGALMAIGTKTKFSAMLVMGTALLRLGLAAAGAGYALWIFGNHTGLAVIAAGFLISVIVMIWLSLKAGWSLTLLTALHRLAGIIMTSFRLTLAFAVIGSVVPLDQAMIFAFAAIAGTSVAITPSGLGISEAISALLAPLVAMTAASGFLAVAINRITGIAATALIVFVCEWTAGPKEQAPHG